MPENERPSSLKFGTSGLRGLVVDLVGEETRRWTSAFLSHVESGAGDGRIVAIGRDLRSSSPQIAQDCISAAFAMGWTPLDCGALPTPALALEARRRGCVAVMVTGSHIPDDRNGLKFYGRAGEITKQDEISIRHAYETSSATGSAESAGEAQNIGEQALESYRDRYLDFFEPSTLSGKTVGVFQQSSVARDLIGEILRRLGAKIVPLGRSESFVPVDTEAHRPEDLQALSTWAAGGGLDAIVSTDGDADRPLVADANGLVVRGDMLGLLTAKFLGLATIVTPVTSSSAIETSRVAVTVRRTKVGSPFVIAEMEQAISAGETSVIGFEANGGVMLGSDVSLNGRMLPALPTRDAMLPIVCALAAAGSDAGNLRDVADQLGGGAALSDRLQNIAADKSGPLLARLADDATFARSYVQAVGDIGSFSDIDGVRFVLNDGAVVHFRASGNAPEFRVYVEAAQPQRAQALLDWGLASSKAFFDQV